MIDDRAVHNFVACASFSGPGFIIPFAIRSQIVVNLQRFCMDRISAKWILSFRRYASIVKVKVHFYCPYAVYVQCLDRARMRALRVGTLK